MAATTLFLRSHEAAGVEHWKQHTTRLTGVVAASIERELKTTESALRALARMTRFRTLDALYSLDPASTGVPETAERAKRETLRAVLAEDDRFSHLFIAKADGGLYLAEPFAAQAALAGLDLPALIGADPSRRRSGAVLSDPFIGPDGLPAMVLALPFGDGHGADAGLLCGILRLTRFSELMSSRWIGSGASGALVDGKGNLIAYSDPVVVAGPKVVGAEDLPVFAPLARRAMAAPGVHAEETAGRPGGERWYLSGRTLSNGWRLGIAQPMAMILGPHKWEFWPGILVLLSTLAVIGGAGLAAIWWLGGRWNATALALQESEGRYRTLFETSPDAVLVHANDIVRFANPAAVTLLRAPSVGALVGRSFLDLVHADFRKAVEARIRDVQTSGVGVPPLEQRLLGLDGTILEVEAKTQMTTVAGQPASLTVIRDITGRKQADEERARNARLYRSVVNGTSEGYWAIEAETRRTVSVNDSLCRLLGYSRDEMLGRSPLDFVDEDNARIFESQMARIGETGHRSYEITLKRKDGRNVVTRFNATTLRDEAGEVVSAYAFVTDITAHRLQEEENRRLHGRLRMLLAATGEGIIGVDALGHVTFVNRATERLTGWAEDDLMGQQVEEVLCVERADECRVVEAFAKDEASHVEGEVFRRRDGTTFPVEYVASPIRDGGRLVGGVLAFHDISERLAAESALAEKTVELERSNADLQQFAYVASHDLQEPLRMVTSYLQLLERRYGDALGEEGAEFIGFAVDGSKRMSALIRDLLEYSRVQTRGGAFGPVETAQSVAEALANLTVAVDEADAEVEVADGLPTVLGDAGQLARLFQNLIGNAIKYRAPDRAPRIRITAEPGGRTGDWRFSIADNGIGIPADQFDRVFMIFQRLHGRGKYEGTGIGLSVCKRIVERHGGRIWIESEPGSGTTFLFTLSDGRGEN